MADSDDLVELDDDCEEVVNISSVEMRFCIGEQRVTLKPKQRVRIHKMYCCKRALQPNRDPLPSVIELETGKNVLPITDPRARGALPPAVLARVQARLGQQPTKAAR